MFVTISAILWTNISSIYLKKKHRSSDILLACTSLFNKARHIDGYQCGNSTLPLIAPGVGRAETAIPVPMWYLPHAKENYWNNSPRLFLLLIHACLFCSPATLVTTPRAERLIFGNNGQRNYTSFGDLMDNREFVGWEEESAMHLPCTRCRSRRAKPYAHAVW